MISNGVDGAREVFGDLLPVWQGRQDLTATLNTWLADPVACAERTAALQRIVLAEHTYERRAAQVVDLLRAPPERLKFAIKIAADAGREKFWGDFHYANSLAAALRKAGHRARVDLRDKWYGGLADTDDVVIVLRGLIAYEPAAHQANFLWIISHPDDVAPRELNGYDQIYVASAPYAQVLAGQTARPVSAMLQCTDTARFNPDRVLAGMPQHEILFVGNSRGVFRESVHWCLEEGLDLALYGEHWGTMVSPEVLKGNYVPNEVLGSLYTTSGFVLCDHWDDMRRKGFISNRVFDVLGAGGDLIVDDVVGLEEAVPEGYHIYRNREDLVRVAGSGKHRSKAEKRRMADWIAANHSFDQRAEVFVKAAMAHRAAALAAMAVNA